MSELPAGWAETTVGEVLQFNYGKGLPEQGPKRQRVPAVWFKRCCWLSSAGACLGGITGHWKKGERRGSSSLARAMLAHRHNRFVDEFCGMPARFWYYAMSLDLGGLNRATAIPGLNREDAYQVDVVLPPQTSRSASPTSSMHSSHGWMPAAHASTACPPSSSASASLSSPLPPLAS